jgi:hypothetical protein
MSVVLLPLLVVASLLGGARALHGQAAPSPSPTLPSDTLEANYAPRNGSGPTPELAPSLPSDTLDATLPSAPDSVSQAPPPAPSPVTPDSAHSAEPSWAPWRLIPLDPPPARIIPVSV